ncbi:MAG: hypothetical protein ABIK79_00175 [Chloroflexota bacterium]
MHRGEANESQSLDSSVEGMEARYRQGTLEEADSWQDLQRLDHLDYKRDRLLQLIEAVP